MSRFKFRAWDIKSKKFRSEIPRIESWWDNDCWDDAEELMEYPYLPMDIGNCFSHRLVWQQFTGLKDANNKEIFEGDILQFKDYSPVEVKFGEHEGDRGDTQLGFFLFSLQDEGVYFHMLFKYQSSFIILGNIFENKELLNTNE
jgi:uncharacterized phage protein (TIGR01671 family)